MIPPCPCEDCVAHAARKSRPNVRQLLQELLDSVSHGDLRRQALRIDQEAAFGLVEAGAASTACSLVAEAIRTILSPVSAPLPAEVPAQPIAEDGLTGEALPQ